MAAPRARLRLPLTRLDKFWSNQILIMIIVQKFWNCKPQSSYWASCMRLYTLCVYDYVDFILVCHCNYSSIFCHFGVI